MEKLKEIKSIYCDEELPIDATTEAPIKAPLFMTSTRRIDLIKSRTGLYLGTQARREGSPKSYSHLA